MGILMETSDVTLGTARPAFLRGFRRQIELFGAMDTPGDLYSDTLHTIAINTRETEFGSIVEPIPITLKTYKQFQTHPINMGVHINGYAYPPNSTMTPLITAHQLPQFEPTTSVTGPSVVKEVKDTFNKTRAPPKKKWIREYLEEEPKSPVSLRVVSVARSNGVVRVPSPPAPPVSVAAAVPPAALPAPPLAPEPLPLPLVTVVPPPAQIIVDFAQEHSRPRTTSINSHGSTQIPSPPSVGSSGSTSSGSTPRAGTREVHNKLEKNRRAHLKECFELLKRQLPATPDDKKTSNLSILGSAIRYIQVLRRKERECEHEMERLAREKIAAQQKLAALKRDVTSVRPAPRARPLDNISDDKEMEDRVNGQVLGISIASSPPRSPPGSLNLSTKLRALPVQIAPATTQQMVRNSFGTRHNTLTLTTLTPAEAVSQSNGVVENGVTNALSTLVHPAQIHLPISQVGGGGGGVVVGGAALQLLAGNLRVLHHHGVTMENNRIPRTENGFVSTAPAAATDVSTSGSNVTPLVLQTPTTHLVHTHTLTHKMVETQVVKSMSPLNVSAQYLSTALVKPVVVVAPHTHTHTHTHTHAHTHT